MAEVVDEEDDPVVQEVDVYLSKQLANCLYLFQYPVRPAHLPYDDIQHLAARVKPKQHKVELELALNTNSANYARSKGEQVAINVDGSSPDGDTFYSSDKMDKHVLASSPVGVSPSRYVIGLYKNNELHLTPLEGMIQLRPSFGYLDRVDVKQQADLKAAEAGDSSQDEEEAKTVTVRFARHETDESKARRMASYEYLRKKQDDEQWVEVQHHHITTPMAAAERELLVALESQHSTQFNTATSDYLEKLIPKMELKEAEKAALPSNVLSMSDLKSMNLADQIKALLTSAKVIRFSQLMSLLPKGTDATTALRCVQQVALLVQGCWVVKSEVLYPRDTFSAYSGVPAETLCRGRDYILWRFTQSRYLLRKDISSVIKLPAEDIKDVIEQIAQLRVNKGWQFVMDNDAEFINRHPEIMQRQQMIWDAKFQQLSKVLNISKADMKAAAATAAAASITQPKRRRTTSRSRTKSGGERSMSDLSDTDTEGTKERIRRASGSGRQRHSSAASSLGEHSCRLSFSDPTVAATNNHHENGPSASHVPMDVDYTTSSQSPTTELKKELILLLREKFLSRFVLTASELQQILTLKLAQCPPGHILGTGVSAKLLDQTALEIGCRQYQNPSMLDQPIYMLRAAGDQLDPIRSILVDMLAESNKVKSQSFKDRLEEALGDVPPEADWRKVLKDYCFTRGHTYYLKGSGGPDS